MLINNNNINFEEILYKDLLDKAQVIITVLDIYGNIMSFNKYMEIISGYSINELKGKNWFSTFLPHKSPDFADRMLKECFEGHLVKNNIGPLLTKNDETKIIEWNDSLIKDDEVIIGILIVGKDITEKIVAEKELNKSERKFKILSENVPGVIYVRMYSDGKMLYLNDNIEKLTGYKKEEFLNGKISPIDLFHPDEKKLILDELKRCIDKNIRFNMVYRFKHKDGFWKWVEETSIAIQDNGNKLIIEGFIYDINKLKQAELQIEKEQKQNDMLLSTLPHLAMLIRSKDRVIIAANKAALKFGIKIGGYCWREFGKEQFLSEKNREIAAKFTKVVPSKNNIKCTFCLGDKCISEDKEQKISFEAFEKIWDTYWIKVNDEIYLHFCIDITEQKINEKLMLESEEKFRTLSENSAVGVYIIDNLIYKYANPALAELYGYNSPDEIINKLSLKDVVHPIDIDKVSQSIKKRLSGEISSINYEHMAIKKNKDIINVEIHGSMMILGGRQVIIGTAIDITERKKTEELMNIRRDLAMSLGSVNDLNTALKLILEATTKIGNVDCGGIYILDENHNISLISHHNLSNGFVNCIKLLTKKSRWYQLLIDGNVIYQSYNILFKRRKGDTVTNVEGLKAIAIIPIKNDHNEVVAFLAVASHIIDIFSSNTKYSLETIAGQVGGVITRLEAEKKLNQSIEYLEKTISEKEALLREVHHRVKNNLQVVSSLLGLQVRRINRENDEVVSLFKEAQDRIYSMSLIHEKLYQANDFSKINLIKYIQDLIHQLMISYNTDSNLIEIEKSIYCSSLDISLAVPLGLIINEVVSNIFKHAFPDHMKGKIQIKLGSKNTELIELIISDNGIGITDNINFEKVNSFGLHLVSILAKPLNGILELRKNEDKGTFFRLLIPKTKEMCNGVQKE